MLLTKSQIEGNYSIPNYPFTLQELIEALSLFNKDTPLAVYNHGEETLLGLSTGPFFSDRTNYADLGVESAVYGSENAATVGEFVAALEAAKGQSYTGWKGGEFKMDENSEVVQSMRGVGGGSHLWTVANIEGIPVIIAGYEDLASYINEEGTGNL